MDHIVKHSKFLSLVLRHRPDKIGLELDSSGWVAVEDLLQKLNRNGQPIDFQMLVKVVEQNDKQRFAFSEDRSRIRANQGHSVEIDLDLKPADPPEILYHGTAEQNLGSIFKSGLQKRKRHHVHLSASPATAEKVGSRHGVPVVLQVMAGQMRRAGHLFFVSENGVWLTEAVPPAYLVR